MARRDREYLRITYRFGGIPLYYFTAHEDSAVPTVLFEDEEKQRYYFPVPSSWQLCTTP